MELTRSNEDYLEAIGQLVRENGSAQVRDIASVMKVKMPSVTSAVRQLSELGLVHYLQYTPVQLTPLGRQLADRIIASHEALYEFLEDVLGLASERAGEVACAVEHIMQTSEIERLKALTSKILENEALFDIHPIKENRSQKIKGKKVNHLPLDKVKPGQVVIVEKISPDLKGITKFADMGLILGAELIVEHSAPLGDPIRVKLHQVSLIFRKHEAKHITVSLVEDI
ncbi:MAG: metal-dependent transcriptional regulator [Akkermansia sp.]